MAMVTSNEPPEYDKQGNIIPDYYVLALDQQNGLLNLQLRAARLGNGNGRIYTIAMTATDESGNASTAEVQIQVPHDSQGNIYSKPTKAKTSLKTSRR